MAPDHARIRSEDFHIPPECGDLQLAVGSAGQIGGVRLELLAVGGVTRLGACYQQVPVRVLPPFHFPSEPAALLYLLNPTAGLMDGDGHRLDICARSGVRAVVTGQSATRIHPALQSFATQQWTVRVEKDAQLVVLPGPAIPFRGSRYYQRVRIELAAGARLVWGDIWLPGRYARGDLSELHQFEWIIQDLEVWREGDLIYRERFDWRGPWEEDRIRWQLGDRQACGSLFTTGPVADLSRPHNEAERAVLPLDSGDICVRWCGSPAEVIRAVVRTALGLGDHPWLLHANNLAPNHWFSSPPAESSSGGE